MPSLINALGFPVPEQAESELIKRPAAISQEVSYYLDAREEARRKHGRQLAKAVNAVGQAAFSPKTYIKAGVTDVVIAGTTSAGATQITELTHSIVAPIPATLWWDFSGRFTETGGTGSLVAVEVRVNGTIYRPRGVATVAANTSAEISFTGGWDSTSADGAIWLWPQTTYTVDVYAFKGTAGATITLENNPQVDAVLRVRIEPRLLAP